jgi:magnesium transporter|tara:strand:- start:83 stop:1105 length:1023 start_codon:yes stop_codon:yes gene_type:complete
VTQSPWVHLPDPTNADLARHLPDNLHEVVDQRLHSTRDFYADVFARLESHDHYLFGEFAYPVYNKTRDEVETLGIRVVIDFSCFLTVTRTPKGMPSSISMPDLTEEQETAKALALDPGDCIWLLTVTISKAIHELLNLAHSRADAIEHLLNHDDNPQFSATNCRQQIARLRNIFLQLSTITLPTLALVEKIIDDDLDLEETIDGKTRELFPRYTEIHLIDVRESLRHAVQRFEYGQNMMQSLSENLSDYLNREQARAGNRLTAMASIMLLPTFIVGLYGMNIDKNYFPEFGWLNGYLLAWLVIGIITIAQVAVFRKMGWLFQKKQPEPGEDPTAENLPPI